MSKYGVVVFNDNDFSLEVNMDKDEVTVWLTQDQISELFETSK